MNMFLGLLVKILKNNKIFIFLFYDFFMRHMKRIIFILTILLVINLNLSVIGAESDDVLSVSLDHYSVNEGCVFTVTVKIK